MEDHVKHPCTAASHLAKWSQSLWNVFLVCPLPSPHPCTSVGSTESSTFWTRKKKKRGIEKPCANVTGRGSELIENQFSWKTQLGLFVVSSRSIQSSSWRFCFTVLAVRPMGGKQDGKKPLRRRENGIGREAEDTMLRQDMHSSSACLPGGAVAERVPEKVWSSHHWRRCFIPCDF